MANFKSKISHVFASAVSGGSGGDAVVKFYGDSNKNGEYDYSDKFIGTLKLKVSEKKYYGGKFSLGADGTGYGLGTKGAKAWVIKSGKLNLF